MTNKIQRSDDEWRALLTPAQYRVLREKGTEPAFSGELYQNKADGTYICGACGERLFESGAKFESGSGWPSFIEPSAQGCVAEIADHSHGMHRTEVTCASCGSHLGHVFDDGPQPTGRRYCINSLALGFEAKHGDS